MTCANSHRSAVLDVQRGIDGGEPVEQHPIEPPAVGELDGAVELDPAGLAGLREHVDRPLVLEHERVGEVVVALEHRARRRPRAVRPRLETEITPRPAAWEKSSTNR